MLKDRIVEIGARRVLLPTTCTGPSGSVSFNELRAILASDRHSLLVTGETGTGKEVLADCVIHATKRPKNKCQRINCAGLDHNLVGSELFGHKKGAYTGADAHRDGLLKSCDGGVLFLDEIGWLPQDLQARLLRFMETGEIRPLGSDRVDHHADVRIVAATNKNVDEVMIPDLRQRFDFEMKLPPLRERAADILWFICQPGFLGAEEVFTGITLRTLVGMLTCEWVGNIRELKKYCQRRVILRPVEDLYGEDKHILDDWSLSKDDVANRWSGFAGFALDALESYGKKVEGVLDDARVRRVLALLVGLHAGIRTPLWASDKHFAAIVPISVLRAANVGELPGMDEFELDVSIGNALKSEHRALDLRVDTHIESGPGADVLDLGGALVVLSRYAKAFDSVESNLKELVSEEGGQLKRVPIAPSRTFVEKIGFAGPDGLLFSTPKPPAGGGFLPMIDSLGIKDVDRDIALLCNQGLSNKDIAAKLGIGASTVQEHLIKLRSTESLRPFLPKQSAGRKPAGK